MKDLVEYPAIVAGIALWASRQEDGALSQEAQAWVLRTMPKVVLARIDDDPCFSVTADPHRKPRTRTPSHERPGWPILLVSPVALEAVQAAVYRRDAEVTRGTSMRWLRWNGARYDDRDMESLPLNVCAWLRRDPDNAVVRTWLRHAEPRQGTLDRMTWPQAVAAAAKWEREEDAKNVVVVPALDGRSWVRLHSVRSLEKEGRALAHCIGNGEYVQAAQVPKKQGGVWSLRDAGGKPVVTLLMRPFNGVSSLMGMFGLRNREPTHDDLRHLPSLRAHYDAMGVPVSPAEIRVVHVGEDEELVVDGHRLVARDDEIHTETGMEVSHVTVDHTAEEEREKARDAEIREMAVEEEEARTRRRRVSIGYSIVGEDLPQDGPATVGVDRDALWTALPDGSWVTQLPVGVELVFSVSDRDEWAARKTHERLQVAFLPEGVVEVVSRGTWPVGIETNAVLEMTDRACADFVARVRGASR